MITLPFPSLILNPNNRSHWRKKADVKQKYRDDCYWVAKACKPKTLPEYDTIGLSITFHPPNKRKRDLDNLLASIKSGLDGLADAWDVNDIRFRPITIDVGDVIKGAGEVGIEIL